MKKKLNKFCGKADLARRKLAKGASFALQKEHPCEFQ